MNVVKEKVKKWGVIISMIVAMVYGTGCRKKIPTQPDDNISYDYPLNLSNDSLNSYRPHIAVDSRGRVYVIWMDAQGLRLKIRDENGIWGDTKFLTDSVFGYGMAGDPYDNIHIIWEKTGVDENGFAKDRLFYREIYSTGEWSDVVELSDTPDVDQPVIGVDSSGGVHVMWGTLYHGWLYKYKPYGGDWQWGDTLRVSTENPMLYAKPDGSLVMLFSPTYSILYYEHPFGGRWSSEEVVDTSGLYVNSWWGFYGYDRDNDRDYVFWTEQTYTCGSNSGEIFYRYKERGVWSDIYKIEGTCGWPRDKRIFINNGNIEVIYDDGRFEDIYYLYKGKNGIWEKDTLFKIWGSMAIRCVEDRSNILHCAWSVRDEDDKFDIYYGEKPFGKIIR